MLAEADQAHPELAVTLTVPVPPSAGKEALVGLSEYEQLCAAAWTTVKAVSATVMVPVRWVVFEFASTEYEMDPFPDPVVPAVM